MEFITVVCVRGEQQKKKKERAGVAHDGCGCCDSAVTVVGYDGLLSSDFNEPHHLLPFDFLCFPLHFSGFAQSVTERCRSIGSEWGCGERGVE